MNHNLLLVIIKQNTETCIKFIFIRLKFKTFINSFDIVRDLVVGVIQKFLNKGYMKYFGFDSLSY